MTNLDLFNLLGNPADIQTVSLNDPGKTFFISDTHFYHKNIIKYCDRPYEDAFHMNRALIENWNKTVGPNDTIIHVGDVTFGSTEEMNEILSMLNGFKILILGNHDLKKGGKIRDLAFNLVYTSAKFEYNNISFLITHVPQSLEKLRENDFYNIHGHIHNHKVENSPRHMNVSVENINYTPVTLDWIIENLLFTEGK